MLAQFVRSFAQSGRVFVLPDAAAPLFLGAPMVLPASRVHTWKVGRRLADGASEREWIAMAVAYSSMGGGVVV